MHRHFRGGASLAAAEAIAAAGGATEARGAALASYLLFESGYTGELMALGERDTQARRADVLAFFGRAPERERVAAADMVAA